MRVLLDHNIPRPLRGYLVDHMVDTANEKGWEELTNGDLLEIAERDGYQVIITGDQNLRFQQNIGRRGLGILVLTSNRWPRIQMKTGEIRQALQEISPGEVRAVPC